MYSSTVECNAADFQCTVQCIAVKADEGDSAAATSWRAPPILPRTALRHLHMVYVQQLSALAGDKQLERASLKCSLPVQERGGAPLGFYSPNWQGVTTSGARSKCNSHLPQQ